MTACAAAEGKHRRMPCPRRKRILFPHHFYCMFQTYSDNLMTNPALPYSAPPIAMQEDEDVNFGSYLATVLDNRRLILTIAFVISLLGIGYAFLVNPVYEANIADPCGRRQSQGSEEHLGEMGWLFEYKTAATAEMELLRSRLVVARAIDNLRLYINVHPKYFPVFGAWLANHSKGLSTPGLFGYGGYAWGAEKMDVPVFNVPDALQNLEFIVTVESDGQYRLRQSDKNVDLKGRVGMPLSAETDKGNIELKIDQIFAKPRNPIFSDPHVQTIDDRRRANGDGHRGTRQAVRHYQRDASRRRSEGNFQHPQ